MLAPHIANRPELEWELHLAETDFDLWRVQGLQPPKARSVGDQQWNRENKTRPYESAKKTEFCPSGNDRNFIRPDNGNVIADMPGFSGSIRLVGTGYQFEVFLILSVMQNALLLWMTLDHCTVFLTWRI